MLGTAISGQAASFAQGEDEVFHYLIPLAEAISLSEAGQHKQVVAKTNQLLIELGKHTNSPKNTPGLVPLLHGDTKCSDVYRQLQAETLALKGTSNLKLKQTADAISDLKKASALCPEHAYILCDLGTAYVKSKKSKEGIAVLSRAIKLNPNLREAYSARSDGYLQIGKGKEGQADFKRSLKLSTNQLNSIDSLTQQIDELVQDNKLPEAIDLDKRLMQTAPRDGLAIAGYADHLQSSGRYKEALSIASIAIALDPSIAYSFRIRSVIHRHLQTPDLELRDANIAFNLEPRSAEALNTRAIANLDMDRPVEAIRDFDLLIKRKPDYADAYINRSTAWLRIGDFANAIKDAKRAVSIAPTSAYGYQCLGAALRRAGKLTEARDALETSFRYAKSASKDSVAMAEFNLGAVLLDLKDAKGSEHIATAISSAPNLAEIFLQRGAYDATIAKPDSAIKILTRKPSPKKSSNTTKISKLVRTKTPVPKTNTVIPSINKAVTTATTSRIIRTSPFDLQDAVLTATKTIETKPTRTDAYYTRGLAQLCLKQYERAAEDFQKFASLSKGGAPQQKSLVLAFLSLERAGKSIEARNCLLLASKSAATVGGVPPAMMELKYFLGESTEPSLFGKGRTVSDQTRSHSYLAFHFNSSGDLAKANEHKSWVLEKASTSSYDLVLTAADAGSQNQSAGTDRKDGR